MSTWPFMGGSLAGLVLAVCLSETVSLRGSMPEAKLVSDAHGALADLCIQYRQDFHSEAIETLHDLFEGLADDVVIRIVVEEPEAFEFLKAGLAKRGGTRLERLSPVITGFPITPWARDRFGGMTARGSVVLAVPQSASNMTGPRGNDERVPEVLVQGIPGATCRTLPFLFEGGDLLADEDTVFLSAVCLARNRPLDVDDRPGLLRRVESALGKRIVAIGETPEDVPDHHICMYLTPLGGKTVAVADPAMGWELYREHPEGNPVDVETDLSKYRPFHQVIQFMERQGFRVVRIPLLLTRTPRVYVSYNNALLERRSGEKRIYMPVYGIPALDRAAGKAFGEQGWQVVPVRVDKLYRHTGSLRCQVGVIRRR
jgi:hypothetical protein